MKSRILFIPLFCLLTICSCEYIRNPFGFVFGQAAIPPQWGMFGRNPRHTNNINTPDEYIVGPQGPDVRVKWKFLTDGYFYGSPAIGDDGTIYFGTYNGTDNAHFYAVNPDGTLKWKYKPPLHTNGSWATPAIGHDGTVYFCGRDTGLFALTSEGELKWHIFAGSSIASPVIGCNGTIYFNAYDSPENSLRAVNPDGTIKWNVSNTVVCWTPCVSEEGTIYCGLRDKDSGEAGLAAIDQSGNILWHYHDENITTGSWATTLDSRGNVYFFSHGLYCIKPDGELCWFWPAGEGFAVASIACTGNIVLSSIGGTSIITFDSSGDQLYKTVLPLASYCFGTIDTKGNFYVGLEGGLGPPVLCISRTGNIVWELEWDGYIPCVSHAPAIDRNGTLYFGGYRRGSMDMHLYAVQGTW